MTTPEKHVNNIVYLHAPEKKVIILSGLGQWTGATVMNPSSLSYNNIIPITL